MILVDQQAVGQAGVGLAPNELSGMKLGRVARKLFHLPLGMRSQKARMAALRWMGAHPRVPQSAL